MARAITSGRPVHASKEPVKHCIALAGKGVPGSGDLEETIEAVTRAAESLHVATRRRGHEWKPGYPEVRLRRPAGVRGGLGWIVRLAVPSFVTARDVHEAAADAATHHEVAKNIRLAPLEAAEPGTQLRNGARAGRDRQPAGIRRTRAGAPQHRARDVK
jgi:hypothetical protein